jgi:hypothetical protein
MSDLPPDSLAARFAQRIAERDNPPPVVLSHEPAAVEARVRAWLLATHHVGDVRGQLRLARMLLALMEHPERDTTQLAEAAGLGAGMAARAAVRLYRQGLTDCYYRGRTRYHCLLPATEDALLLVVAGPAARPAPEPLAP